MMKLALSLLHAVALAAVQVQSFVPLRSSSSYRKRLTHQIPHTARQPLRLSTTTTTTTTTTTNDDVPVLIDEEAPQENDKSEQFDWFKSWYPLVPVEILDPEKPHRFQLLGMDIVVWNDAPVGPFAPKKKRPRRGAKRRGGGGGEDGNAGTWRAFVDECPHRKVPLSEGRVEDDGTLLCSYHAWRFDGEGKCVAVPQIGSEESKKKELERVKSNPKTSCNAFPTKVLNGVLFVWPSSDENAVLESELTAVTYRPALADEDSESNRFWEGPWNFRELPYGADFFLENVVDPAHVTVSHHNVVGSRYGDQQMTVDTVKPLTKEGFSIQTKTAATENPSTTNFMAPSLVAIDAPFGKDGAKQTLELYCSPSRPGFCNHVGRMVIVKDKDGKMPKLLRTFTTPMPKWLNHVLASAFLNQDALFLHHQERHLAQTGQYKAYYMEEEGEEPYHYTKALYPVNSDKGVLNFRNWMRQLAGGGIPYKNHPTMPPASKDVVFDVWNSHTKYCRYCQDALRRLKKVRFASLFAAVCVAVIRPARLGVKGSLASTLALAGMGLAVNKLIGLFYRYEFSHAHND